MTKVSGPPTNDKGGPGAILLPQAQPLGLKQIQNIMRQRIIPVEKQLSYFKGLVVGSEAGDDLLKEIEKLETAIEELKG